MPLNNKTKEELMAIAKIEPKVPFKKKKLLHLDYVKEFILDEKLKPSEDTPIPAYLVYMRYHKWSILNHMPPLSINIFFNKFRLHFNSRIIRNERHYFIEADGFDMSAANLEQVKNDFKKQKSRPTKKAKEKSTTE